MKYLAIIAKIEDSNYVGFFADPIPALGAANTWEKMLEQLPILLVECFLGISRNIKPKSQSMDVVDPQAIEGYESVETVWVELGYVIPN